MKLPKPKVSYENPAARGAKPADLADRKDPSDLKQDPLDPKDLQDRRDRASLVIRGEIPQIVPENPLPPKPHPRGSWARTIQDELDELEADVRAAGFPKRSIRTMIIRKTVELARLGVPWAIQFLADREDGKPRQQLGLEGSDGGELTINVVKYDG